MTGGNDMYVCTSIPTVPVEPSEAISRSPVVENRYLQEAEIY